MKRPSFTDFDGPYRRGVVMGLSLAELFIILVFLLLLAIIAYASLTDKKIKEAAIKIEEATKLTNQLKSGKVKLTNKLADEKRTSDELRDSLTELKKENKTLKEDKKNLIKNEDVEKLIEGKNRKIKELEKEKDNLTAAGNLGERVSEAAKKAGISKKDIPKIVEGHKENQEYTADLEKQLKEFKNQNGEPADSKGQNSPCWFSNVKKPNGKFREKPLYIFNIRIFDDGIFTKDIPAPNEKYVREKKKLKKQLKFDPEALNRKIGFPEFIDAFKLLKKSGDKEEVRDRRCRFYVKVWDETTTKKAYKNAYHDNVQAIFGTYLVQNDEWLP